MFQQIQNITENRNFKKELKTNSKVENYNN